VAGENSSFVILRKSAEHPFHARNKTPYITIDMEATKMPRIAGKSEEGVQSALLAFRVMQSICSSPNPIGVTALADVLGTTKSRVFRHLQTLLLAGYVEQEPDTDRYRMGLEAVKLACAVFNSLDLASAAQGVMRDLRDELGYTTVVAQLDAGGVRVVSTEEGVSPLYVSVKRGTILSFHATAQGKVALAFGPSRLLNEAMTSPLPQFTCDTIDNPAKLGVEVELVKQRGWAVAPNETLYGFNALAAPIFGPNRRLIGTLSVVASVQHIGPEPSVDQVVAVLKATSRISEMLGG
jgi:IclR family transcriptional regulator, KDG regulon repressor